MLYLKIYFAFLKIGGLAFGGGFAMLPYMQKIFIQDHHWLTSGQFNSYIGLVQVASGPVTVNLSTYIGYKLGGVAGSVVAVLGIITIPCILVTILYLLLDKLKSLKWWDNAMVAMKPALIALIFTAFLSVSKTYFLGWKEILIGAVAAYLVFVKKLSSLYIIIISAILGIILYMF